MQAALGLKLELGQVRLVFEPQVLRPFRQAVLPALGLPDPVDGLVGVLDHMELVDHFRGVGQPLADALGESQAHVARHQAHAVGVAVARHEVQRELFDGVRVLARRHVDHVAFREVGDHSDVVVAPAAGLVDAYRLHARVVLAQARLLHVMADEPPQAGVVLADLFGDVRHRLAFRQFHDHGLEQEREPAAGTRPRHRHRPDAMPGARRLPASRLWAVEARARPEANRDVQLASAVRPVAELHARHTPRVRQLQGGGEQRSRIHTTKLADRHHRQ